MIFFEIQKTLEMHLHDFFTPNHLHVKTHFHFLNIIFNLKTNEYNVCSNFTLFCLNTHLTSNNVDVEKKNKEINCWSHYHINVVTNIWLCQQKPTNT